MKDKSWSETWIFIGIFVVFFGLFSFGIWMQDKMGWKVPKQYYIA